MNGWLYRIILVCAVFLGTISVAFASSADSRPPNFIYIMMDDMDYLDLPSYGADDAIMPNTDRLVADGMRFTQMYANAPICSPTRASYLTSQFPIAHGWTRAIGDRWGLESNRFNGDTSGISPQFSTIAHALQANEYATTHFGKWHIGLSREAYRPHGLGFDSAETLIFGSTFTKFTRTTFADIDTPPLHTKYEDGYIDETLTALLLQYIEDYQDEPFFINAWFHTPHYPLDVPPMFDNECCGFDLETDRGRVLSMLYQSDVYLGMILDKLEELDLVNDTIIVYTSDNGGYKRASQRESRNELIRGYKADLFEGGIRVPFVVRWPNKVEAGTTNDTVGSLADVYPTFLEASQSTDLNQSIIGQSLLLTLLSGNSRPNTTDLIWDEQVFNEYESEWNPNVSNNSYAIRHLDWKLVSTQKSPTPMLFDLSQGIYEGDDLASDRPDIVQQLLKRYMTLRSKHSDIAVTNIVTDDENTIIRKVHQTYQVELNNSTATIPFNDRYDKQNMNFSYGMAVKMTELPAINEIAIIAQRDNIWKLYIDHNGKIFIQFFGIQENGTDDQLILEGGMIEPMVETDLIFTIDAFGGDEEIFSLYRNNRLQDQVVPGIDSNLYSLNANNHPIVLGNEQFIGIVSQPRMATIRWFGAEMYTYALFDEKNDLYLPMIRR